MRIKVELHRDVVWYIRHRCNRDEARSFYQQLDKVRREPITNSEAIADPKVSRYMLRFFRFRQNIAVFEYDIGRDHIRVLECRIPRVGKGRQQRPGGVG